MPLYDGSRLAKCASFLYVDLPDEGTGVIRRQAAASAFFIGVPVDDAGENLAVYLVTARHVVQEARAISPLIARVNSADGFRDYSISDDAWVTHRSSDVAVVPVSPAIVSPPSEGILIPISEFISDRHSFFKSRDKVWMGDPVYFVGFFNQYPGKGRNEPVLRFGNVSLVPEHPIEITMPDATRLNVEAYLVEARSWGGHSGSPAFLAREMGPSGFLGLVSGHYTIPEKVVLRGDLADEGSATLPVNAGMAIVIPAQHIVDLLMQEELVEGREKAKKRLDEREEETTVVPDVLGEEHKSIVRDA